MKISKVLVVCHGNINRSQLFAAVLRSYRPDITVREASLASLNPNWHPVRTAKRTRDFANDVLELKLDHRSRKFDTADADWADYIVYFDNGNLRRLNAAVPQHEGKFICAGSLIGQDKIADPNYISDPKLLRETMEQIFRSAQVAATEWK